MSFQMRNKWRKAAGLPGALRAVSRALGAAQPRPAQTKRSTHENLALQTTGRLRNNFLLLPLAGFTKMHSGFADQAFSEFKD